MRLAAITIRNFKGIKQASINIPRTDLARSGSAEFVSLVGENNCSKSSLLEAIGLACPGGSLASPTLDHFHHRKSDSPIEVELEFSDLSNIDRQQQAIRTRIVGDRYRIRKSWATPERVPTVASYSTDFECTVPLPTKRPEFEANPQWKSVLDSYETEYGKILRFNANTPGKLKEHAIAIRSPVVAEGSAQWIANPGGFQANVDAVLPRAIFVPAIKDTKEEVNTTKAKSTIRQIVNVLFEQYLFKHHAVQAFNQAAEGIKDLFHHDAKNEFIAGLENQISSKLRRLINVDALFSFSPPDVTSELASKTELWVRDGDITTRPEHQGHGAQRAIILALFEQLAEYASVPSDEGFRRPILLLIEEPEIYLHPEMCRKMRDVLLRIARSGIAQVICTTHSPVFLDLADRHDGIVICVKRNGTDLTHIQRTDDLFGGQSAKELRDRLRMILNFDASANEVFFTDSVCLVEGDCELAAIDAIATKLIELGSINREQYLLARRRTTLINCRGKLTIPAFQKVLNAFKIPFRVIHDSDIDGNSTSPAVAAANASIKQELGPHRALIHTPNFEKQLFSIEWLRDKPWKARNKILELTSLPTDLIKFFEFAIGKSISELAKPTTLTNTVPDLTQLSNASVSYQLRRRKLKDESRELVLTNFAPQAVEASNISITINGASFRLLEFDASVTYTDNALSTELLLYRFSSEAMQDSIHAGDWIAIDATKSATLTPLTHDHPPISSADFLNQFSHNDLCLVAINDQIRRKQLILRRVRIEKRDGTDWLCVICADNPNTPFGHRGQFIVRDSDHVQLIGPVRKVTASNAAM